MYHFDTKSDNQGKTYRQLNCILLLVLLLLGVAIVLIHFTYGDTTCWLKKGFGRECILCGCTRDFVDVFSGKDPCRNPLTYWLVYVIGGEIVWRVYGSLIRPGRIAMIFDISIHAVIAAVFLFFNFKIMFGF